MDSEKVKTLLKVLETGSLSAAAEELGYTPSGISRMMASLEEEAGFALLIRGWDGIRATPACKTMLPSLRRFVKSGEDCAQTAAEIRGLETGSVVIGTAYSAYYRWLGELTRLFRETYPGISVSFSGGFSSELLEKMQKDQLDLCIISRRESVTGWVPLKRDPMMAWVPGGHPLAKGSAVPLKAFERESFIETFSGEDIDDARLFKRYKITPKTQFTTRDSYATWQMVSAGLGISLNNQLNGLDLKGNVKVLPLEPPQEVEIGIAYKEGLSPAAEKFLRFMSEHREVAVGPSY